MRLATESIDAPMVLKPLAPSGLPTCARCLRPVQSLAVLRVATGIEATVTCHGAQEKFSMTADQVERRAPWPTCFAVTP